MTQIFEIALLVQEKRDVNHNIIEPAELVLEPQFILAKDQTQATLAAGKRIPEPLANNEEKMDRLMVVVRPF